MVEFPFAPSEALEKYAEGNNEHEEVEEEIRSIIRNMEKEELLDWLTAFPLQPGNEDYLIRFLYAKHVALSIPEDEYKGWDVEPRLLKQIIDKLDQYEWIPDNYISFPNDEKNRFCFKDKIYRFLGTDAQTPELTLKRIVKRDIPIQDRNEILPFSIEDNLEQLLTLQNSLHNAIQKASPQEEYKGIQIPSESFVGLVGPLTKDLPAFSEKLWRDRQEIPPVAELDRMEGEPILAALRRFHIENPVVQGRVINPNWLIESFEKTIESKISELDEDQFPGDMLHDYLARETLRSLSEVMPKENISFDISIEGVDNDDGIHIVTAVDDQLLLFRLHTMQPNKERSKELKKDTRAIIEQLDETIDYKDVEVTGELRRPPNGEFTPSVSIVSETSLDVFLWYSDEVDIDLVGMDLEDLRYIMEQMAREELSLFHFIKAVQEFDPNASLPTMTNEFRDFFELTFGENYQDVLFATESEPNRFFSIDSQRKILRNEMPMLDLRPSRFTTPYIFKTERIGDGMYFGYNHLIDQFFYCYRGGAEFYSTWDRKHMVDYSVALHLLAQVLSHFIKQLDAQEVIEHNSTYVDVSIDIQDNLPEEDPSNLPKIAIGDSTVKDNSYMIAIDSEWIQDNAGDDFETHVLPRFISVISPWLANTVFEGEVDKSDVLSVGMDSIQDYSVSSLPVHSGNLNPFLGLQGIPTKIDLIGVESMLYEELRDEYDPGVYTGSEAREIAGDCFEKAKTVFDSKLREYDFEELAVFGYGEQERLELERRKMLLELLSDSYESKEALLEDYVGREDTLNRYGPGSRLVIERAYVNGIDGSREITVMEWQHMVALSYFISNSASMIDYGTALEGIEGAELVVQFNESVKIDLRMEEDLGQEQLENKGEIALDQSVDDVIPEYGDEHPDNLAEVSSKLTELKDSEPYVQEVEEALKETYGFDYSEYTYATSFLFDPPYYEQSVIKESESDLIDHIVSRSGLEQQVVADILDFMTMEPEGTMKPWQIDSRNRLTISPVLKHKGELIYGPASVENFESVVLENLWSGHWTKPGNPDEPLKQALQNRRQFLEDEFEEYVHSEIEQLTDAAFRNVRGSQESGEKILTSTYGQIAQVNESCPGEMDVVSLDSSEEEVTIWEVKNMRDRHGARDIINKIGKFTEDSGYISKLLEKEKYVRENLSSFTTSMDVDESWGVTSVFILPDASPLIPFLSQAHRTSSPSKLENLL